MKKIALACALLSLTACDRAADVASRNLSVAADQFEINRRIVFYNGITDSYMLTVEGLCALGNHDPNGELTVVCKVAANAFKKHFLGLSDNVTYFVEQLDPAPANVYHYRVIFKPSIIIPDVDLD